MEFEDDDYKVVESVLIEEGNNFNRLQKEFIELFETKTIIAGPGAGKTTALVAKICLLIKKLKTMKSNDGICIITHTNVAINEINSTLIKCGIGKIEHPHFIGTIHEFLNRFCVYPYFRYYYSKNNLIIDKSHNSDIDYYKSFLSRNYSKLYESVINSIARRTNRCNLYWNKETNAIDLMNNESWDKFNNHKSKMLRAKIARKSTGIITHDDTFIFANAFLKESRFKEMIRNRFKYIFLDEFQDTSLQGIELLDDLFSTHDHIFQKIGDPYQTISYQLIMPEIHEENTFRINLTNRFGSEIANCLNTIVPSAEIKSIETKKSLAPILLVFDDTSNIYKYYKHLINEYEQENIIFKETGKLDKILIEKKRWVSEFVDEGVYKEKKQKKNKSRNTILKESILDFVQKRIIDEKNENISQISDWLKNHKTMINLHAILIKILRLGITVELKNSLRDTINILLEEKEVRKISSENEIFNTLNNFASQQVQSSNDIEVLSEIFTIHAVKGETLRSVLLLDFDSKNITKALLNAYDESDHSEFSFIYRNLLYVAISRVTHLFVFAIHKDDLSDKFKSAIEREWEIIDISSKENLLNQKEFEIIS